MSSFIQITRHLYEEPHQLNLVIIASNGYAQGVLEFYSSTATLTEIGSALSAFPSHDRSRYLYQGGSEYLEDRFGWYLRLRAQMLNSGDECLLQLRFNNNERIEREIYFESPQITDFCIRTNANSLQRLGSLLKKFSKLNHQRLYWTPDSGFVDNNLLYRDRRTGDTLEAARLSLPMNGGVS